MKVISKKEALQKGLKRYFTGLTCKNGHLSERYLDGNCIDCNQERYKKFYVENTLDISKRQKKWREANPEKKKQLAQNYFPEYQKKNRKKFNFHDSIRRAKKLKATPKWADVQKIKEIYLNCPKGMHVDHIIPLQNDLVCGLHVPENLQYLTPQDNSSKNNKFEPLFVKS